MIDPDSDTGRRYRRSGYPRPVGWVRHHNEDGESRRAYPVPWINGEHGGDGDFYSFRRDEHEAHEQRLCCICGDPLGHVVALGALRGVRETSGGWGHPRCIKTAVRLCPHFAGVHFGEADDTVAWLYTGDGVGVAAPTYEEDDVVDSATPLTRDALERLAASDPWGRG